MWYSKYFDNIIDRIYFKRENLNSLKTLKLTFLLLKEKKNIELKDTYEWKLLVTGADVCFAFYFAVVYKFHLTQFMVLFIQNLCDMDIYI